MSIVWRNGGAEGEVVCHYGCRHGSFSSLLILVDVLVDVGKSLLGLNVHLSGKVVMLPVLRDRNLFHLNLWGSCEK